MLTARKSLLPAFLLLHFYFLIHACSPFKQLSRQADTILLKDSSISTGHIGISIYEPATGRYWYEHDATKYFVPASNTKLFTLYAGMKYLKDSLPAASIVDTDDTLYVKPSGDPTFLHSDYTFQPLFNLLAKKKVLIFIPRANDHFTKWGMGWAWDDYMEDYMCERSAFPVYGNVVSFRYADRKFSATPPLKLLSRLRTDTVTPWIYNGTEAGGIKVRITRDIGSNNFNLSPGETYFKRQDIPFLTTPDYSIQLAFLADTLGTRPDAILTYPAGYIPRKPLSVLHSQPVDSFFKPMMHRSDNFFAEQTLLMVSNEKLGYMSDEKIIDTLLQTDLKDISQKPKWVDGCGLSRYNLFTPQSFIYILRKMKEEFGMERLTTILATGGEGTLRSYYKKDAGYIFAKTGTLSNHCALSGYLYTKKGKLLLFSILTNHYRDGATPVRKAVERFLENLREKY